MIPALYLYGISTLICLAPLPALYLAQSFSIFRIVIDLFVLDTVLTIEAAYYSDVIAIAILHIITVPAFFAFIYFDLIQHHKNQFSCFLCGTEIGPEDEIETVKRLVLGKPTEVYVHARCLSAGERKAISGRVFRKGIPK